VTRRLRLRTRRLPNSDQEPYEEETQAAEATTTEIGNSATSSRSRGTDKMNAGNGSRRTNCAETHKDKLTGQGSTSWMRSRTQKPSTPSTTKMSESETKKVHLTLPEFSINQKLQLFPSNFRIFSKELDDSPHPSS
jgi:hypothetical protein